MNRTLTNDEINNVLNELVDKNTPMYEQFFIEIFGKLDNKAITIELLNAIYEYTKFDLKITDILSF